jgi:hypothetical protein
MTGLAEVAQELYALPLAEFVAARTARAKEQDDRAAAAAVKRLAKPSVAAWAINMLSTHRPELLDDVAELGERLRDAQDAGDGATLRELEPERRAVLREVEAGARELADDLDQSFGPAAVTALHETLLAALSDGGAADAVRSGVLVQALGPPGFGPVDLDGATAVEVPSLPRRPRKTRRPATPRAPRKPPPDRVAEQRAKALAAAEAHRARAEQELTSAEERTTTVRARRDEAEQKRLATEKRLAELTRKVAEVDGDLRAAGRELDSARAALESAVAAVERHSPAGPA